MGDSKRRKQLDPNYGKSFSLKPDLVNHCNSLIAQEGAFVILDCWTNSGGIAICPIDIKNLESEMKQAYDIVREPDYLNLGIRRQYEQGLGAMGIMDRHFRENVLGLVGEDPRAAFIFNWYTQAEIAESIAQQKIEGKGKTIVFAIMDFLIRNCDREHQFPCWFSGVPSGTEGIAFVDLIFICDRRNPSQSADYQTLILNETFL